MSCNMETKQKRRNFNFSLIIGLIAFLIAIFEGGIECLMVIPLFLIATVLLLIGLVPFAGAILYYLLTSWIFDYIIASLHLHLKLSSLVLLVGFLIQAVILCFIVTGLLILFLSKRGMTGVKSKSS